MIHIALSLIGIITLFIVFVFSRSIFSLKICALCGAVFLAWITLVIIFYLGYSIDPVFIALLIGGSITGSMYFFESKIPEGYLLFRLPYFLTLISIAYFVLTKHTDLVVLIILGLIWITTYLIHIGQRFKKIKTIGRKIIDCCKNW